MLRRAEMTVDEDEWIPEGTRGLCGSGFELPRVAASLLEAQEEERRRVSRELHDELGQSLALLEIQIEEMKRRLGSDKKLAAELVALRTRVGEIADDLHRICYRLHPAILENLGLITAVRSYCDEYNAWTGIRAHFSHADIPARLPPGIALCLYRVVQESLRNVAKHSHAARAVVELRGLKHGVQVLIKDNGCGFVMDEARAKGRLGLISVTERVRLAGGACEIRSTPGHGTQVQAWVPLAMEACAG